MAEATRIRGMFEASRFASSVVKTRITGRVPLFSCPPPGTPLTDRLCSRPEPFILRSAFPFGHLRCMFRFPISDIVRQISTCGPLSQYLPPQPYRLVHYAHCCAVPYVEGSTKWQRNIPPPASVRLSLPSRALSFLRAFSFGLFQICGHDDHAHGHH
jgi:hypothetical protein